MATGVAWGRYQVSQRGRAVQKQPRRLRPQCGPISHPQNPELVWFYISNLTTLRDCFVKASLHSYTIFGLCRTFIAAWLSEQIDLHCCSGSVGVVRMAPVIARHARRWIRPSTSRATPSSTRGHHTTAACPPSSAALSLPVSLSAMQRVHSTSLGIKPRSDVNAAAHSGVLVVEFDWHHAIARPPKTDIHEDLADISYTSWVIADFVPNFCCHGNGGWSR